jgi:hypothetical protein
MKFARTRFWIAFLALAGLWLAMLVYGGPDEAWDRQVFAEIHGGTEQSVIRWAGLVTQLGGWIPLTVIGIAAVAFSPSNVAGEPPCCSSCCSSAGWRSSFTSSSPEPRGRRSPAKC